MTRWDLAFHLVAGLVAVFATVPLAGLDCDGVDPVGGDAITLVLVSDGLEQPVAVLEPPVAGVDHAVGTAVDQERGLFRGHR